MKPSVVWGGEEVGAALRSPGNPLVATVAQGEHDNAEGIWESAAYRSRPLEVEVLVGSCPWDELLQEMGETLGGWDPH